MGNECCGKAHDGGMEGIPLKEQMPRNKDKNYANNNSLMNSTNSTDTYGSSTLASKDEFKSDPNYSSKDVSIDDFEIKAVIGRGSFGKVYVVTKKEDDQVYAMKTLKKDMIMRKNQVQNTKVERQILERLSHPFIVKLHYAF